MTQAPLLTTTITLLTSLTLLGCNPGSKNTVSGQGELVNYQCRDGTTFTVRIREDEAIADLPNNPNLALPAVASDSGAKYSDGNIMLEIHGPKAAVEINGATVYTECVLANPTTASQSEPTTPTATAPSSNTPSFPAPASQSSTGNRVQRVQFAAGATSAVLEDEIVGYDTVDYLLGAQAGQYMNVSMATDNSANYFNILAPGETDVALFNGSLSGNQYEGTLPESGDYTIRVYMMRSAARRDEVANYRLEMIISGSRASASGGGAVQGDAKVAGTDYNATGTLDCAMTAAAAEGSCAFGVVREGNGNGFVEVTTQYGSRFSIYFQNGEAVGAEGGSGNFSATRQGDTTYVYIGEERYVIPDAIIYGG